MQTKTKLLLALSALILTVLSCKTAQRSFTKRIDFNYSNVFFSPVSINKTGLSNVEIAISPIDAASINRETFEAANRDGSYEKELISAIDVSKREINSLSRNDRIALLGNISAIEAVNRLERENKINSLTAYQFKNRIFYGSNYGYSGDEVILFSDTEIYDDRFNPYKINNRYLSVFRLLFTNNDTIVKRIAISSINIVSGTELLNPLTIEFFEKNVSNPQKLQNILRMNMPDELVLAPNQKIIKYISVPAINPRNTELTIQIIENSELLSYKFDVAEQSKENSFNIEQYIIYSAAIRDLNYYRTFYAVSFSDGTSFALKNNRFFIPEDKKNIPLSVYAVSYYWQSTPSAVIKHKDNIILSEISNNIINIEFNQRELKR